MSLSPPGAPRSNAQSQFLPRANTPSRNLTEPQHNAPSSIRLSHWPETGMREILPGSRPASGNRIGTAA